jgi:hypothetical protein
MLTMNAFSMCQIVSHSTSAIQSPESVPSFRLPSGHYRRYEWEYRLDLEYATQILLSANSVWSTFSFDNANRPSSPKMNSPEWTAVHDPVAPFSGNQMACRLQSPESGSIKHGSGHRCGIDVIVNGITGINLAHW